MKNFKNLKILVIGDIIMDEYVNGSVTRISPEAPIPILDKKESYFRLGGASNVAKNVVSIEAQTTMVGQIGFDPHGDLVKQYLRESGINTEHLQMTAGRPTILKTRFTCGNIQLLRVDYEDKSSLQGTDAGYAMEMYLRQNIKNFDAVIVSDYQKGVIHPDLAQTIMMVASAANIPVVADTHKKDWSCFKGYTCLTPNKKELEQAVGRKLETLADIEAAGMTLRRDLNLQYLLVTLSEHGMMLMTQYTAEHIPVEPIKVVDVTGCGDTAIAVFTVLLASGRPALTAAQLANHAAGIVCEKMGTASITFEELS